MARPRILLGWILGGAVAAAIGFFAIGTFVSKTEPASKTLQTLAPFSLPTSSGDAFSSEQLAGRTVLINFWATTCSPCLKEFPMIMELSNAYEEKGMKIYFVTTDWMDYKDKAIAFLEKQGVRGLTFIKEDGNDNNFIRAISDDWSGALPFTMVFDINGQLTDAWEMERDKAYFETAIQKALAS